MRRTGFTAEQRARGLARSRLVRTSRLETRPCRGGHPYVPMRDSRGWRRCLTCHNQRSRKNSARERAEKVARYGTHDLRRLKRHVTSPMACAQCGAAFERRTRREWPSEFRRRKYCSPACVAVAHQGNGGAMWRGGEIHTRGPGWIKRAETIRRRDGYCCQRCGRHQDENGGRRLSVDHIIPWRAFTDDQKDAANAPANLVSLCTPCHGWKTAHAEQRWLRGDVLDFKQYERAIRMPSASKFALQGQG